MNEKWDRRFLELAELISSWSKDPSSQVGSVIVSPKKEVISLGFNGFPSRLHDNPVDLGDRSRKYKKILHSEINSILYAKRDLASCSIYIYPFLSCADCTKVIIQSGITRVVTVKMDENSERYQRWKADFDTSREMYQEAGVEILEYIPAEIKI
jgi:dCMP deaminase